ncbi:MAG: aspartate ammonia-lyase [Deltaproteobacteria bacterium]|nr:aspartate ammonia-lyase [Deltaproteobacteria bacterium]
MPERFRREKDSLGERTVPADAYYGIQTLRAHENFQISGLRPKRVFIRATALVKYASASANLKLGLLDKKIANAIMSASKEVAEGLFDEEFIVDVYQAGAGTSHNMNANEVVANRATELLGGKKGDYSLVHPNDHVNRSQSTNDTMPTALRLAIILSSDNLTSPLASFEAELRNKSKEFSSIIKSGRTHLQDAVPVTLGEEFGSYASAIANSALRIKSALDRIRRVGLGATAAGTGMNTHPRYRDTVTKELSKAAGVRLVKADDPFEALNSLADFSSFSGELRNLSLELIRVSNDLRLLSSGPNTGLGEISLPAVQPGSSIMPGKVNPVMAEMLAMVSFQAIGNDTAVAMAAQAGQLELNVMGPVVNYNILQSIEILGSAISAFTAKCVAGIKADEKRCSLFFEGSAGLATVLNTFIGYERAASVAKEALRTGKTIKDTVIEKGIMTGKEWDRLMDPALITAPADLKRLRKR